MNYPIESLAIIAPVIFVILVVAFPLIGVFAGWKRAAYWGGGNFIFYILGLIIWVLAGNAIAAALKPMITNLLSSLMEGLTVTDQLIASVISPVWFILFMAVSELILLINYYAWYKKVVGLKKVQVKTKNGIVKQYAKVDKKANTVGYKVGNKLGGAALLGILTLPTTMAFTQVIYNGTTSSTTRAKNSFSSGLYNGLSALSTGAFSWLAYNPNTTKDFDALYSALVLYSSKIQTPEGEKTILEVIEQDIGSGIVTIFQEIQEGKEEDIAGTIDVMSEYWNAIVESNEQNLTDIFESENATTLISQMVESFAGETSPEFIIDETNYEEVHSTIETLIQQYEEGQLGQQLVQVPISEGGFNNIKNVFWEFITVENPEYIGEIDNQLSDVLKMFFK